MVEPVSEVPLFKTQLMLDTHHLYFEPSLSEFHEGMMEVLISFKDCTLAFPNLVPDPYFHSFTRYLKRLPTYLLECIPYIHKEKECYCWWAKLLKTFCKVAILFN